MDTSVTKDELISIIVPVYNVAQYLERCMHAIWQQTYQNLEIILVDDGSTDNSGAMCDAYAQKDKRIKVIHKANGGLSDARNAGLKAATGAYIGYVDSDDWIEPQMYDTMYRACKAEQADLAICRYHSVYQGAPVENGTGKQVTLTREELLDIYLCGHEQYIIYNSVWSKLFSRKLVEGMVFPKGRNSEDIMYTTKAFCKAQKAVYIDRSFYHYVLDRAGSIMNEKRTERMFRDELPFWREHIEYITTHVSKEMGAKAAYYYYRRLLFYFTDLYQNKETKPFAKKIAKELKQNRKEIRCMKQYEFSKRGDLVRMDCMLVSPALYYEIDALYQKIIIPLRRK